MPIDEAEPRATESQFNDWRKEFIANLADGKLPTGKWEARRLKRRSAHYVVMDGELHRWTATKVLLKCISSDETRLVMAKTHEGVAGNHSGGASSRIESEEPRFLLADHERILRILRSEM